MNKTEISYTNFTWNPTHGCSSCSTGCRECWAKAMSKRLAAMGAPGYSVDDPFKVVCMPDKLNEPLKRKKPAVIAVSFMGDLFHDQVPDEFIDKVFGVMALAKQHRFIVLTKRAKRMCEYMNSKEFEYDISDSGALPAITNSPREGMKRIFWPPSNVMGMVTVENNQAIKRIDWLMKARFAMRGISFEPLLEEVDLITNILAGTPILCKEGYSYGVRRPNWIIVGGESGHKARPMHPQWARDLRDRCVEMGTPFFFKQWGEYMQCETSQDVFNHETKCFETIPAGLAFKRVSKKKAGHLLDGEEWHQIPEGMKL